MAFAAWLCGTTAAQGLDISKSSDIANVNKSSDPIAYTVTVQNNDTVNHTGVTVTDTLPDTVTFVPGSSRVTAPADVLLTIADDFTTIAYNNNSGDVPFNASWVETPADGGSAATGVMQITSDAGDNRLRIAGGTAQYNIYREAPLAGVTSAVLSFKYRRDSMESPDSIYVDVSPNPSNYVQLMEFKGPATDAGYLSYSRDITQWASGGTRVRFRVLNGELNPGGFFYIDDFKITYSTRGTTTTVGLDGPVLASGVTLKPGESITAKFDATLNQPLAPGTTNVLNLATVTADGGTSKSAQVFDSLGSIYGRAFRDDNSNGTQDIGEPPLPGVQTQLVNAGPDGIMTTVDDIIYPTATTGADGFYYYNGLAAGQGRITVDPASASPLGGVATTENRYFLGMGLGITIPISDVGVHVPAVVSGRLFLDSDANGIDDDNSDKVYDYPINITPATGAPFSILSNAAGDFSTSVPAGITTVSLGTTSYSSMVYNTTTNSLQAVQAVYGEETSASAIGLVVLGIAEGTVFHDENRNGTMDGVEAGIGGISVSALFNGKVAASTVTAGDGSYSFRALPGSAVITVDASTFNPEAAATTPNPATSNVVPLQTATVAPIGLALPCTVGTVAGRVFNDLNGNGVQDAAEPGLGAVGLTLWSSDGSTTTLLTDSNGAYTTATLQGETTVTVDMAALPAGSHVTTSNTTQTITAVACEETTFTAVGIQQVVTVSGFVFNDLEHNGQQDIGEVGLDGILLTLADDAGLSYTVSTVAGAFSTQVVAGTTTATLVMSSFPNETEVTTPGGLSHTINTPAGTAGVFPAFGVGFRSTVGGWHKY